MLENCQTAQQRWGGVSDVVDKWLKERQQTLVSFCELSQMLDDEDSINTGDSLRNMCQLLVDYVSAGHFEVYDQLVKEGQAFGNEDGLAEARKLFKAVDNTTEHVLDFNDKYQEVDDLETLSSDLSRLGEVLASRFEAEDQAIEVLHLSHKSLVADH